MTEPKEQDFDDGTEQQKAHFRKLLREGKVEFSAEAKASITAKGMTEDDIIAFLVRATKTAS
mgnify:FL=1